MKISNLFSTKRSRVITITVSVVLVLAVVMSIVLYATGYILPYDTDGQPSERLLNTIKRDYALQQNIPQDDISILYCCGYYNGCVPVMITASSIGFYPSVTRVRIAGVEFAYGDSRELSVWRFGRFYSLSEAYENKWLDHDDLLLICETHNKKR